MIENRALMSIDTEVDQLEKMSFAQMLSYRERIIQIASGNSSPDRAICLEWMLHDTVTSMRDIDEVLANDVAQGFCQLLHAQTSQERASKTTLGSYLEFREIDVGRPYVPSLSRTWWPELTAFDLDFTQPSLDSGLSCISLPLSSRRLLPWKARHFGTSVS